ncbi:MAG: TolC family protein [Planctomycetota bacterium]
MDGDGLKKKIQPRRNIGIRQPVSWLLFLSLWLSACVAGREDALEMRDENMYKDLAEQMNPSRGTSSSPLRMGEKLREGETHGEGAESLTQADCFRLAQNNAEDLLIQGEQLFSTWTYEQESISSLLPSVSIDGVYSRDSEEVEWQGFTVSPRDSAQYWFSLRQTVFDGRSFAAVPAARAARKIEQLNLQDRRDRLLYAVAASFFEILGVGHDIQVFEASLASADEFLRVVEARRKSGEASRQEAMSAQAQRDKVESQLIQARHDLEIARSHLAQMTCIETLPATLIDTYEVTCSPDLIPALVETATAERADLKAARAGVELAEAERQAALSEYLPVVTAGLTRWIKREGAFSEPVDWNFSLDMSWNLFDSFGREARQARTLSGIRRQELVVNALERQVKHEVHDAVLSYESLGRVLGALSSRADASRAALELATAEYNADEATNLDVQVARSVWEEAARDLRRAELAQKLSALKIQLVCGRFSVTEPLMDAVEIAAE